MSKLLGSPWSRAALLLLSLDIVFFVQALSPDALIYGGDLLGANYPFHFFKAEAMRLGELPLWNPYSASGIQFTSGAGPLFGFYLPSLLFVVLPTNIAFTAGYILHLFLAGLFTLLYGRRMGLGPYSAAIAAMVFMFSGATVARIFAGHFVTVQAIVWLPLLLHLFEIALERRSLLWAAWAGAVLGLQFLNQHFQLPLYEGCLLFAYGAFRLFWMARDGTLSHWREWLRVALLLPLTIGVGAAIGAAVLLPMLEATAQSLRSGGLGLAAASASPFAPHNLITLIAPDFFGNDVAQNFWGYFLGATIYHETAAYVGIVPLLLAALALLRVRSRFVLFFGGLALFCILFAMGKYTPIFDLFQRCVPGFALFRAPGRSLIIYSLAVSMLAGYGASLVVRRLEPAARRWLGRLAAGSGMLALILFAGIGVGYWQETRIVAFGQALAERAYGAAAWAHVRPLEYTLERVPQVLDTAVASLYFPALFLAASAVLLLWRRRHLRSGRIFLAVLAFLVFLDLWCYGGKLVSTVSNAEYVQENPVVVFLKADSGLFRVYSASAALPVEHGMLHSIFQVQGAFPMTYQRYWRFINPDTPPAEIDPAYERAVVKRPRSTVLSMLNVRYAVSNAEGAFLDWPEVARFPMSIPVLDRAASDYPELREMAVRIYRNPGPLPRAFLVPAFKIANDEEALAQVTSPSFDPRTLVILDRDPGLPAPAKIDPIRSSVAYLSYGNNSMTLSVENERPALLVLSEVYYPGWRAWVDGSEATIYRANYTFRALRLEAGQHTVEMAYQPEPFRLGVLVTAAAALLLVGTTVYRGRRCFR